MKSFEKIVHDQVSVFVKENSYLNNRQSGFRKLFSTTTAVLDVSVAKNHRAILCDNCDFWAHIKCENISKTSYTDMSNISDKKLNFICSSCLRKQLPFPEGLLDDEFEHVTSTQTEFELPDDDLQAIENSRGLKIAHLSTNGLLSKLDFLKIMLSGSKFDVLAISESKLDANIHDNEIKIDGYVSYRLDRNRHGGGVLFYVNEQLESHLLQHI